VQTSASVLRRCSSCPGLRYAGHGTASQGSRAPTAETTWSVWSGSPAMDPSAVTAQLKKAEESGDINSNSCRRLEALHELLIRCETDSILAFEVDTSPAKTCILGWSKMNVKVPEELNSRIREMVKLIFTARGAK
jgi:hypothetical protein